MFTDIGHADSEGMTVAIKVTVNPVTGVEDVLARLRDVLDIVYHLHVESEAISDTVPSFYFVDILNRSQEDRSVGWVELVSIFKIVEVEATASRADAVLVELVLHSLVATAVGEGQFA